MKNVYIPTLSSLNQKFVVADEIKWKQMVAVYNKKICRIFLFYVVFYNKAYDPNKKRKGERILDLAQQGYNIRQIAQDTHTSFRDIAVVLKKESQQRELEQVHSERLSTSTQAIGFFLKVRNARTSIPCLTAGGR